MVWFLATQNNKVSTENNRDRFWWGFILAIQVLPTMKRKRSAQKSPRGRKRARKTTEIRIRDYGSSVLINFLRKLSIWRNKLFLNLIMKITKISEKMKNSHDENRHPLPSIMEIEHEAYSRYDGWNEKEWKQSLRSRNTRNLPWRLSKLNRSLWVCMQFFDEFCWSRQWRRLMGRPLGFWAWSTCTESILKTKDVQSRLVTLDRLQQLSNQIVWTNLIERDTVSSSDFDGHSTEILAIHWIRSDELLVTRSNGPEIKQKQPQSLIER